MGLEKRELFEQALDNLRITRRCNAVVVLRNWDDTENMARVSLGIDMLKLCSATMVLLYENNTADEAEKILEMALDLGWKNILLVTHKYHSYRAYLTFVKVFENSGVRLFIKTVPSGQVQEEMVKIEKYIEKGDCATYEEGLRYVQQHMSRSIST